MVCHNIDHDLLKNNEDAIKESIASILDLSATESVTIISIEMDENESLRTQIDYVYESFNQVELEDDFPLAVSELLRNEFGVTDFYCSKRKEIRKNYNFFHIRRETTVRVNDFVFSEVFKHFLFVIFRLKNYDITPMSCLIKTTLFR